MTNTRYSLKSPSWWSLAIALCCPLWSSAQTPQPQLAGTDWQDYQPASAAGDALDLPTPAADPVTLPQASWIDQCRERGITFQGKSTHFGFGIEGGINTLAAPAPLGFGDSFEYTGRGEYDALLNLGHLGSPVPGQLKIGLEHWYGEYSSVGLKSGSLVSPVFAAMIPPRPNDQGDLFLTHLVYTHAVTEQLEVFIGKQDVLSVVDQSLFAGGDGTEQFVNQALISNPAVLAGMPYTSMALGANLQRGWGGVSVYAFDPQDRTGDVLRLGDIFSQGVIAGGELKVNSIFLELPGQHRLGGVWKNADQTDLTLNQPAPGVYPYPVVPGAATVGDGYTVYYGVDQFVRVWGTDESGQCQGWGLFARASVSDANPNPLRYFLSGGLGGNSPLGCHRGDRFGVGWYYTGTSNEYGPVPQATYGNRDGAGLELFYRLQASSRLSITPDLQFIKPEADAIAQSAVVYGVRVNWTF